MLKIYCTECGHPTTYSLNKPKFCSNCGNSFEKITINKTQPEKPTFAKIQPHKKIIARNENNNFEDNEDFDYDNDVNIVPDLNGLDCEILESKKQNLKIKDIIGTADAREKNKNKNNKKLSKIEKRKFLEEFKREAGALRPKKRD